MNDIQRQFLDAQGLMHDARGYLRLCGHVATRIAETPDGNQGDAEDMAAVALAIDAASSLILEAVNLVTQAEFDLRKGVVS